MLTCEELVWLATCVSSRLRALPPPRDSSCTLWTAPQPPVSVVQGGRPCYAPSTAANVSGPGRTLTERIEAQWT